MFENIFNTVMNMRRKTKGQHEGYNGYTLFFNHKNMRLVYNGLRVVKPKVSFVLDKNAQLVVYQ
jgi:hypothetical protein